MAKLFIRPMELADANRLVERLHRHHGPARGHRFSIGLYRPTNGRTEATLVGCLIAGRPVSRMYNQTTCLEVLRVATDGTPNACSLLYAAAARAAKALGFVRIQTYTLASEPGTSLRAAGWRCEGPAGGGQWGRPGRPRSTAVPEEKHRWARTFGPKQ